MSEKNKKMIAVFGDPSSIIGFRGLGLQTWPVEDEKNAEQELKKLIDSNNYAIVYVTAKIALLCANLIEEYRSQLMPAIISIPMGPAVDDDGLLQLQESVKRAIGFDILKNDDTVDIDEDEIDMY